MVRLGEANRAERACAALNNLGTWPIFEGLWSHYGMCEPVDFDGDGLWEVLAGFDRGAIFYWKE